jgi:hypothetical protein
VIVEDRREYPLIDLRLLRIPAVSGSLIALFAIQFSILGLSPGDVYVFDAPILAANGRTVLGRLRGTQTEIKIEHGTETVQGMLTYQLGTGNDIVVGGLSANPLGASGFLVKNKPFVRAVLGGTGKYSGARGTVTTTRLTTTRYLHVF